MTLESPQTPLRLTAGEPRPIRRQSANRPLKRSPGLLLDVCCLHIRHEEETRVFWQRYEHGCDHEYKEGLWFGSKLINTAVMRGTLSKDA